MDAQRRWLSYDTFKLIVLIILLLLLLYFYFQRPPAAQAVPANLASPTAGVEAAQIQATNTVAPLPSTATVQPSATATLPPPTATLPPPTATPPPPAATPTPAASPEPTAAAAATAAPAAQPTATAAAPVNQPAADCPGAQPSRLSVGKQAVVVMNLNLRQEAGMDQSILKVSLPNSRLDVIGGPVCLPYQQGAYLWWNVKTADGVTGWSAEASISNPSYFMQPVP